MLDGLAIRVERPVRDLVPAEDRLRPRPPARQSRRAASSPSNLDDRRGQFAGVVLGDEVGRVADVVGQAGTARADHRRAISHRQARGIAGKAPRIREHAEQRPLILADRRLEHDLIKPAHVVAEPRLAAGAQAFSGLASP